MNDVAIKKITKNDATVLAKHGVSVFAKLSEDFKPVGFYVLDNTKKDSSADVGKEKKDRVSGTTRLRMQDAEKRVAPRRTSRLAVAVNHTTKLLSLSSGGDITRDSLTSHLMRNQAVDRPTATSLVSDMLHRYHILEVCEK